MRVRRLLALAAAWAAATLAGASARAQPAACFAGQAGPCRTPEPFEYLPAPLYPSDLLVANFGLLARAPSGGWHYVCDDAYGLAPPDRVWRAADGTLLAAGRAGLQRSEDGGCSWTTSGGDLAGVPISDLALDRQTPARIWALGADRRVLYRSTDGGRTFATQRSFADDLRDPRLLAAPSDNDHLFLVAATTGATTRLEASRDGGQTWTSRELTAAVAPPLRNPLALQAIAPDDPATLYFSLVDQEGDEIWKSPDGGQTLTRLLELSEGEVLGGFTFGPTGSTLFVAGSAPIVIDERPPARLYRSDDGGRTWAEPVPSTRAGPFYRCLTFAAGRLLACGAGESGGDRFLVGASDDLGQTWSPVVGLADLAGPRSCARASCIATELWLCETYGRCGEAADAGVLPSDGSPGTAPSAATGCGCGLGGPRGGPAPAGWAVALLLALPLLLGARAAARQAPLRSSPGKPPPRSPGCCGCPSPGETAPGWRSPPAAPPASRSWCPRADRPSRSPRTG
jgi:photosystem II stability/assembly factor-like uncharacterized protein